MVPAYPYLLLPPLLSSRNRARRRERGDLSRGVLFGVVGVAVCAALFQGAFWLTGHLEDYAELGDFLLRMALSWLFLTFLSFLAFSGVVTALSTFFLADDLRLLLVAPVATRRLFHARFLRTVVQSSWMVVIFLVPVLLGVGRAKCAGPIFYLTALLTVVPFSIIPVAAGTAATLVLVNTFPAKRARDILMLMGLLFAASLVIVLRFIRPEQLLRVESLPDLTDFFATLQSPITPLLPSFWAGETLFASLQGGRDLLHAGALWTTALASVVLLRMAGERWYFSGFSRSQEAPKARFTRFRTLDRSIGALPLSPVRRQLLIKDLKIFLRDVSQWSQLLLLLALVLLYLYNFRVLDLSRIPYMSGFLKNIYAFINLGMAGFVMATVAVRFAFPAVSAEGASFWIVRTSPITLRDFLWSKFWTAFIPVLILTEVLTVAANEFLGVDPFLKVVTAAGDRGDDLRSGRARGRSGRALSALRRGRQPGRGLVRRRHVHDAGGAVRDGDDRAARLAIVDLPAAPDARQAAVGVAAVADDGVLRRRTGAQRRHLDRIDAFGHRRPRAPRGLRRKG